MRSALGIALVAAAVALFGSSAGNAQQATTGAAAEPCELHVSGSGRPNFIIRKSILIAGEIPSPEEQRERFRTSPFNLATRAQALPDYLLVQLLPDYDVTIVRHAEIIDTDRVDLGKTKTRLYPSSSPCYADLVLTNSIALWPNPDMAYAQLGIIGALIVGGNRVEVSFRLSVYEPEARKPAIFKDRVDSPIASSLADMRDNPERFEQSVNASFADALRQFAAFVARKRRT